MALTFEFIQPGEFDDPEYEVTDHDGDYLGYLFYSGGWLFTSSSQWGLSEGYLYDISRKLEELNSSTEQQSFFWGL